MRAARARKQSPVRALVGRANGGMVVHLGIILIAIAIAASRSSTTSTQFVMKVGDTKVFQGHTIELVKLRDDVKVSKAGGESTVVQTKRLADIRVDGGRIDTPALTRYDQMGATIGTPSVRTGLLRDIYLTYIQAPRTASDDKVIIGVYLQPMVLWLWVGLGIVGIGTILAMVPGKRRRPTEPVSAPAPSMMEPVT
jgi:cytochrome c-type biogenesis protein CcmF